MSILSDSSVNPQDSGGGEHGRYVAEIQLYEKQSQSWEGKGKKICRRYKNERNTYNDNRARYNILWSNVQTLQPALYARNPKPDIERRNKKRDPLSRVTADIIERTVTYYADTEEFGRVMRDVVLDRLLPGRGVAWVRYVPHFRDVEVSDNEEVAGEGVQLTDDTYAEPEDDPLQEVHFEDACVDYVHWQDFGHNVARTVEELSVLWRKVYLSRQELVERFGEEIGNAIQLDYSPKGLSDEKISDELKKGTIYEIWDKSDRTVRWLHKDYPELLDKRTDPLKLKDFFPCPMPLLATTANDTIIPVPDYEQYEDQAKELDMLTARIAAITKSLKVAGIYPADAEGVERLLAEGTENQLIPIDQWQLFAEKGGLKGVIEFLPVQEIAQTLLSLYEAREAVKKDLYEITGLADIIRGQSNPNETATAQQIKGQFATLRLSDMQQEVQRFARDLVRIIAQIVCQHFSVETIKAVSGVDLFTQQEKAALQMQMQQAQQMQQQFPMTEELEEKLASPTWEEVEALIRNDALMSFRIDIETDSTIKQDEDAEKAARVELLQAVSSFVQQAQNVQAPALKVLMIELLAFGVRSFRAGKQIEGALEVAISKLEKEAQNPAPPPPDPETIKIQSQEKIENMKLQAQQQKDAQMMQLEAQKAQAQEQAAQQQAQLDISKSAADRELQAQLERERMANELALKQYEIDKKMELEREMRLLEASMHAANNDQNKEEQNKTESNDAIARIQNEIKEVRELTRTKQFRVIRDVSGNIQGGEIA